MAKKKVKFMCTAFRDGFQSVYGARVLTKDFIPAVEAAVEAGIDHFESGGGARFQSLFFYCNENAFDMMDAFRSAAPNANLQTLARGVNVVGLDSQPSDIITLHARLFKKHGVTTIRNFDALNDVNNLVYSGQSIVDAGLKHQVVVTMMELPPGCTGAHNPEFYASSIQEILDAGIPFDSFCFKDASGTSTPHNVYESVKRARRLLPEGTPIHFHTHETAGIGVTCYQAALEAGADLIDLSLAPCSSGTCQPDVLTMWHALRGTDFELDVDIDKILVAEEVFKDCMMDYFLPPEATAVEPLIPWSPMPGGALTANTQMLRDNGIMDKFSDIIKAMKEVVERGGYGTSVTPVSQFYFQQAFNNVMFGNWKTIADGYGKMVLGYFGKTPVKPDPEIVSLAAQQMGLEPTTRKVVELNDADPKKGIKPATDALLSAGLEVTDENIFIAATCKQKGIDFLLGKAELGIRLKEKTASGRPDESGNYTIMVNGKNYKVSVDGKKTTVNGRVFTTDIQQPGTDQTAQSTDSEAAEEVIAPMPGKVFKVLVNVGDLVAEDAPVIVLEAMKMETEVIAHTAGTVAEILVSAGEQVAQGDVLVRIR